MVVRIEKELCNPVSVNGYCEVPGPLYHIYKVHDDGTKEFVKTVEKDIKEAAREAQRAIDINVLEVAYKERPEAFSSVAPPPNAVLLEEVRDDQPFVLHTADGEKMMTWKDIKEMYTPSNESLGKLDEIKKDVFKVRSGAYAIDDNGVAYSKEAVKNAVDEFNKNRQSAPERQGFIKESVLKELHAWACGEYNAAELAGEDERMLAFQEVKRKIMSLW